MPSHHRPAPPGLGAFIVGMSALTLGRPLEETRALRAGKKLGPHSPVRGSTSWSRAWPAGAACFEVCNLDHHAAHDAGTSAIGEQQAFFHLHASCVIKPLGCEAGCPNGFDCELVYHYASHEAPLQKLAAKLFV